MVEKTGNSETERQVESFGQQIEKRIFEGKAEIMMEPERIWLRWLLEKRGVNFESAKPKKSGSGESNKQNIVEPNETVLSLGGVDNFILVVQLAMEGVTDEKNLWKLEGFVEKYLLENTDEEGRIEMDLDSGDVNDVKMVAVVSAIHRILRMLGCSSQEEALAMQANGQTNLLLRERMLRREEKKSNIKSSDFEVQRDTSNPKLRTLAANGVEAIFAAFLKMKEK